MSDRVSFLRQDGWISPIDLSNKTLNIIGCGAVGSNVAMIAARMGWSKFQLWDLDIVENHNLPNQAYCISDLRKPKVVALKDRLLEFNPQVNVTIHNKWFVPAEDADLVVGPLVLAADTMKLRKEATDVFSYNTDIPQVVEARLGFIYAEIHNINPFSPEDIEKWVAGLKDDSEIAEGPCNLRLCSTLVQLVAATMVHYLCVLPASQRAGKEAKLPFQTKVMLQDTLYTSIIKTK